MPNNSKTAGKSSKKKLRPAQTQSTRPGREDPMRPDPVAIIPELRGNNLLKGRVALVTGGDSGIGRATAVRFAREGAKVAIAYLEETEDAEETQRLNDAAASRPERRKRREDRREKQRIANVVRAAKMHQARLNFEREAPRPLAHSPPSTGTHVGCSGWFYWHWRNGFYPSDIPTSEWFTHYAKTFKTVELNAPFYSWPTTNTVHTWIRQAGRRKFLYTVKVSDLISHVKKFRGTKTLIKDFGFIADVLGPRFGCFLFQLPPSFHFSRAALSRIVEQLDPSRRNVVEFRHRTWWNPTVYKTFERKGIIFCSCSAPRLPDELIKTADDVYVRFHGKKRWYMHDYSNDELEVWADRIRQFRPQSVWAYFNNDRDLNAIKNARQFRALLK